MGGRARTAPKVEAPAGGAPTALAAELPGEAKVDDALVDQAVERINRLYTGRALEMAREIGGYVLEKFFGGDANNFREKIQGSSAPVTGGRSS